MIAQPQLSNRPKLCDLKLVDIALFVLLFLRTSQPRVKILGILVLALLITGTILYNAVTNVGIIQSLWLVWTFIADPGTHASQADLGGRIVAFVITLGGIFCFSLLVAVVTDNVTKYVEYVRKGNRSQVLETDHSLILGWNEKIAPLSIEISLANQSNGRNPCVVILSEREKEVMEASLDDYCLETRNTVIICRQGSPMSTADLKRVSVTTARVIIILSEEASLDQGSILGDGSDMADTKALRVMLSVLASKQNLAGHMVVELCQSDNRSHVELIGGRLIETVCTHDILGRCMIQCARSPGLAAVMEQILGFKGDTRPPVTLQKIHHTS